MPVPDFLHSSVTVKTVVFLQTFKIILVRVDICLTNSND